MGESGAAAAAEVRAEAGGERVPRVESTGSTRRLQQGMNREATTRDPLEPPKKDQQGSTGASRKGSTGT